VGNKQSRPAPDYGGIFQAMAAQRQAEQAYALGQQQFDWAKGVYDEQKPYIMQSAQANLDAQKQANEFGKQQMDFYNANYQPLERDYLGRVQNWDTPEMQQQRAGEAQSAVASQFEQARQAAQQRLEGYGVDPTSTRFAALDIGTRAAQAAAAAGAGTKAIQDTRMEGMGLRAGTINTGRGYANTAPQSYAVGSGAGSAAAGALNNQLGTGAAARGSAVPFFGAGNSAMGNAVNAYGNVMQNQTNQWQIQNQQSSGLGGLLGAGLGMAKAYKDFKGFEEGGAVPTEASPSQGAIPDDVPARLTEGEFVLPREAVEWLGLKHVYGMVDKAKQEREQVQAETQTKPQTRAAIPEAPAFTSRPQVQAAGHYDM